MFLSMQLCWCLCLIQPNVIDIFTTETDTLILLILHVCKFRVLSNYLINKRKLATFLQSLIILNLKKNLFSDNSCEQIFPVNSVLDTMYIHKQLSIERVHNDTTQQSKSLTYILKHIDQFYVYYYYGLIYDMGKRSRIRSVLNSFNKS